MTPGLISSEVALASPQPVENWPEIQKMAKYGKFILSSFIRHHSVTTLPESYRLSRIAILGGNCESRPILGHRGHRALICFALWADKRKRHFQRPEESGVHPELLQRRNRKHGIRA